MTIPYAIVEQAVDGAYIGPQFVVLTPAEFVAWTLWKLGA